MTTIRLDEDLMELVHEGARRERRSVDHHANWLIAVALGRVHQPLRPVEGETPRGYHIDPSIGVPPPCEDALEHMRAQLMGEDE